MQMSEITNQPNIVNGAYLKYSYCRTPKFYCRESRQIDLKLLKFLIKLTAL